MGRHLYSGTSIFPDTSRLVFGGLVWILVASTRLLDADLYQGWVMFVSVTLFVFTTILFCLYVVGAHKGRSVWTSLDAFYHYTASLLYLSAAVLQAYATIRARVIDYKVYQENIAAVVFCYIVTLLYVIHAVGSLLRWKRSS
ncbi:hypothetical protein GDO78_009874 [Eleutherodactylus coqui]|uniref:Myelin and lymphocyte protein n=1 Tax=Eleutherodactylus coqui TaxID=57060 RepID=A0A8J6F993_ELECQ|nr:hypothetical protein GDO78_009874 [Eleutherodactylus coqui]